MAAAFKSRGVSLPPWRTLKAIRSKWSPVTSHPVSALDNRSTSSQSLKDNTATEQSAPKRSAAAAAPCKQQSSCSPKPPAPPAPTHRPAVSNSRALGGIAKGKAATPAPWRVQTGFQVSAAPATAPSVAAAPSAVKRAPVYSAFDMWSHQPRQQQSGMSAKCRKAAFCVPPLDDRLSGVMAPIRTVKMCGRTRA